MVHALLDAGEARLGAHVPQSYQHDQDRGQERGTVERGPDLHERREGARPSLHHHRSDDASVVLHHRRVAGLEIRRPFLEELRMGGLADHGARERGLVQRGPVHHRGGLPQRQDDAVVGIQEEDVRGARAVGQPSPLLAHRVRRLDRVHRRLEVGAKRIRSPGKERVQLIRLDQERRRVRGRLEALPQLLVQEVMRGLDRVDHGPVDEHEKRPQEEQRPQKARRFDRR